MGNNPVFSHFGMETIISQSDRSCCFKLKMQQGYGTANVYSVLPGVEVVFLDCHAKCYTPTLGFRNNILEINYIHQGRVEFALKDGHLQYHGVGDFVLQTESKHSQSIELPLGFYRGIVITVDLDRLPIWTMKLLPGVPIDLKSVVKRLFAEDNCFCCQAKDELRNIFEQMYVIPEEVKIAYFRLKVQELLLYLHFFDISKEKSNNIYERQQVVIVKDIHKRITEELNRRFTVEELSKEYFISPSALRLNFKGIYGISIHAYMKEVRIKKAAELLKNTDMDFAEITNAVGYKSQSKLGAAFKAVMNMTPSEYRKAFARNAYQSTNT